MAGYHYDLPFDIMDVATLLDLRIKRRGGRSVYADCPFCGDTRAKFNLNLEKNVFRCNYCGESGGALALYGKVHGVSNQVAYQEISDILYGNSSSKANEVKIKKKEKQSVTKNSELASLFDRNQTYEMMLSMLVLSSKHKEDLLERGISEDHIDKFEYRSTPIFGYDRIVDALAGAGCVIEGIPGFYRKNNKQWTMNFKSACSGILIPVRTLSGMIQGFQIRLDRPFVDEKGKKTKYIWFSSIDYEMGVTSGGQHILLGTLQLKLYLLQKVHSRQTQHIHYQGKHSSLFQAPAISNVWRGRLHC